MIFVRLSHSQWYNLPPHTSTCQPLAVFVSLSFCCYHIPVEIFFFFCFCFVLTRGANARSIRYLSIAFRWTLSGHAAETGSNLRIQISSLFWLRSTLFLLHLIWFVIWLPFVVFVVHFLLEFFFILWFICIYLFIFLLLRKIATV